MPCLCGLDNAACGTCGSGWAQDLRQFITEVDWEGKAESWNEAVFDSLAANDIKVRRMGVPRSHHLRLCVAALITDAGASGARQGSHGHRVGGRHDTREEGVRQGASPPSAHMYLHE